MYNRNVQSLENITQFYRNLLEGQPMICGKGAGREQVLEEAGGQGSLFEISSQCRCSQRCRKIWAIMTAIY